MNNDLISRQKAIDILDAYQVMVENGEENPYAWARLRMSELSSAQSEVRTQIVNRGYAVTESDLQAMLDDYKRTGKM